MPDDESGEDHLDGGAQEGADTGRSGDDEARLPPGVGALQAAAREAISATRALLDAAEALVDDPETVERVGSVVRAATDAAARAARGADTGAAGRSGRTDDDDGDDGVQRIPVA